MIQVTGLCFQVGDFRVSDINLEVAAGEYFVLLGPTGSAKTLLLKCLCGLVRALRGTIRLCGQDVTSLEPRRRGIGYVPQDCGLFPHMDVARNIAFPLRVRGTSYRKALAHVRPLAEALGIEALLDRLPAGLSGGESQKVALARALASRPQLLLLDEPVSALDEPSRKEACSELRRVQRQFGIATIHVCHSTEEALTVGDRAGVLCSGRLIQTDKMDQLVRRPRNEVVAALLHAENLYTGRAKAGDGDSAVVGFAGREIRVPGCHQGEVRFTIRPESVRVLPDGANVANSFRALLTRVDYRGSHWHLEFDGEARVVVYLRPDTVRGGLEVGRHYVVQFPLDAVHVLQE
jgi:ABC-type sugar transport system ATPase subunit